MLLNHSFIVMGWQSFGGNNLIIIVSLNPYHFSVYIVNQALDLMIKPQIQVSDLQKIVYKTRSQYP